MQSVVLDFLQTTLISYQITNKLKVPRGTEIVSVSSWLGLTENSRTTDPKTVF